MKFQPVKTKYIKPHTVIYTGKRRKDRVVYGDYALTSEENWFITDKQLMAIETLLKRISNKIKTLKYWFRVFPQIARTKKPEGVRRGSGKGAPDHFYAPIRKGKNILEISGANNEQSLKILKQCMYKLPIKVSISKRDSK